MNKLKQSLEKILKQEESFIDLETKEINYNKVKDSADKIDEKLISLLAENKETKDKFFTKIKDIYVFNINDFKFFLDENKVNNSYTQYANQIGLSDGTEFIKNGTNVVLDFPFKDCVLEGGQNTEEGTDKFFEYEDKKYVEKEAKRNEVFFNQLLAHDEIDRLFDKKALVSWKRYTKSSGKNGELVKEIERGKNGLIKENLIIKGNNLLALHSLKSEFKGKIKVIYIDPPYNTAGSGDTFVYNNNFKHSTWYSFIKNRLEIAKDLLTEDGFINIAIDHFELCYLGVLADEIFGRENKIGIVSVVHKPEGRNQEKFFATSNEFMLVYAKNKNIANFNSVVLGEDKIEEYNEEDDKGFYKLNNYLRSGGGDDNLRVNKKHFYYPIYVSKDLKDISLDKKNGYVVIYPITSTKQERTWKTKKETFEEVLTKGYIVAQKDKTGKIQIYEKYYAEEKGQLIKTHWIDKRYNAINQGTNIVEELLGSKIFSYPKSIYLVQDTIKIMSDKNGIVLDFFAGSGTTGHAVLNLNKEDGGNRKFILIEQMDYIQTVTVPRIKEVIKRNESDNSFLYLELAKWNEQAKEEINEAKDLKTLEKMFDNLYEKYFLNYNLKIKEFKEKIIKEENFKKLNLNEQKKMFLTMLDLNQMYVQESEMADKKFGISKEDQKLTKEFYQNK